MFRFGAERSQFTYRLIMLSSIIRKSVTRATLHKFYVSLATKNYTLTTNQHCSKNSALQCITLKHNAILHRHLFNKKNDLTEFLPLLPGYVHKHRSLIGTLTMLLIEHMTLRPVIDSEFNTSSIAESIKNAACNVSIELVNQNYDALVDLVDQETLKLLQERIDSLSEFQRNLIAIKSNNVLDYTPAYIKVIGTSFSPDRQTYSIRVEMNVLIFYMPCYGQPEEEKDDKDTTDNTQLPEELVANYVFARNYTENGGSDWTISYINLDTKSMLFGY